MSYRYRKPIWARSEDNLIIENANMRRVAVSSIAWLDRMGLLSANDACKEYDNHEDDKYQAHWTIPNK